MASTFNCSFKDLGDTARLSWQMCDYNQASFFGYKPKYTKAFINENLTAIQVFLNMDAYDALFKIAQDARQAFYKERDGLITSFQFLKGYNADIEKDKEKLRTLNKDAGQQVYEAMSPTVWKDMDALANAMLSYMSKHQADLLAAGMPADFLERMINKRATLLAASEFLVVKEAEATAATEARITAGNTLKANVMAMFKDGQLVFRDDKETAKKFVWDSLLGQIRGDKDTGLAGKIMIEGTKTALPNATVSMTALNLSVVSDADGKYSFLGLAAAAYDVTVTCIGYQTKVVKAKEVKMNSMARLNIELTATAG